MARVRADLAGGLEFLAERLVSPLDLGGLALGQDRGGGQSMLVGIGPTSLATGLGGGAFGELRIFTVGSDLGFTGHRYSP